MADKVINIGNSDNKVTVNVTDKIVCPTFDGTATKVGHKLSFGNKTFDGSSTVVLSGTDLGSVDLISEQTIIGQKTFSGETYLDSLNANTGLISGNLRVVNGIFGNLTGNVIGNLSGNASTATKLQTARTLTIGNTEKSFDGSSNVSWTLSEIGAASSGHTHNYLPLSGGTITGQLYLTGLEEGSADVTDNTELLTSYASNNGFGDTNATGKVYKRDAIHVYNYIKNKLDSVYSAIGHTHSYLPLSGGTITGTNIRPLAIKSNDAGYSAIQFITSENNYITFGYKHVVDDAIPQMFFTNKNGWDYEYRLLHSGNYNNYAPTLTGTGASGTWGINISGNAATADSVDWSGVTNKPNFVNSFGTKTGDITIRGGQTGNGSVNLAMSNNELQASIVGLGSNAYTSTAYLPLSGGTMNLGEGLKFHADDNYFGTNLDARIISLLDGNGTTCDGGLIIDERATSNGVEYVTELLRIRDSEFKWKGNDIYHKGNLSPMTTSHPANSITQTNIDNWNAVHTWYTTATADDTTNTIDTWKEIEAFVSGFKKEDNLATYLANNYLAKAGGTISSTNFGPLIIERSGSTNAAAIQFKNSNGILGYIGMGSSADGGLIRWKSDLSERYTILDSSNSSVSLSGSTLSVKINGTTKSLTNTDSNVYQSETTTDNWRKLVLSTQYGSSAAAISAQTGQVYINANIECQPSTGTLKSTNLQATSTVSAGTTVTAATSVTSTAGDFYVGGTSGSRCHIKMDTANKCIKFIFD